MQRSVQDHIAAEIEALKIRIDSADLGEGENNLTVRAAEIPTRNAVAVVLPRIKSTGAGTGNDHPAKIRESHADVVRRVSCFALPFQNPLRTGSGQARWDLQDTLKVPICCKCRGWIAVIIKFG